MSDERIADRKKLREQQFLEHWKFHIAEYTDTQFLTGGGLNGNAKLPGHKRVISFFEILTNLEYFIHYRGDTISVF